MKAIALLIVILSLFLLPGCSDDPTKPAEHKTEGTTKEIGESGGTISLGDVTVEIPPSAISSKATFTLNRLGYDLADSLDVEAEMMSQPVSMTIGTAEIVDTIYVLLPAFDSSDIWNVVGFKVGGVWYPLSVVEQDATHTRVAIPPELFEPGTSSKGMAKGIEPIPGYVIAGMNLHIPNPSTIRLTPAGLQLNTPAIVLIHGIFSDSNRWESVFIDSLRSLGAGVYYLEYPWKDHFMDVAPGVIDTLKQRLGNRDIYFVCHSKGGLLARAVIRLNETEHSGLSIKRALFFDTPHYGVSYLAAIELLLKGMYAKDHGLIMPGAMLCGGISELISGSSELAAIAQPLSFVDRPLYKCIIADDELKINNIVSASSADLARQEHNGERENAVYCSTYSMPNCAHWEITNYNGDAWSVIKAFMRVESDAWNDDFESYEDGTFPSTWVPDGNGTDASNNYATSSISFDGDKSLRLFGRIGSCWASLAYHPLAIAPPFEVELAMLNGTEALSGCHPFRANFGLRKGADWMNPAIFFIQVLADGSVSSYGGGVDLGSISLSEWHAFKIRYERPSVSETKISYWIDGSYKGFETIASQPEEDQMLNLELSVQEGTVWYDAVRVAKSIPYSKSNIISRLSRTSRPIKAT